jgi:hypothetical protein
MLQELYSDKYNIAICGYVNVNYVIDNSRRSQQAVFHSYNLAVIFSAHSALATASSPLTQWK